MCGKFTAMASWSQVVAYSEAFTLRPAADNSNDRLVTLRVMSNLPVIVWDADERRRKVLPMRWGFPHPKDWRRPQPIHARGETVDELRTFKRPFLTGQRGIVLMRTFNEGKQVAPSICEQWTIDPKPAEMTAAAFLWDRFDVGAAEPLLACVLVTVPANALIRKLSTEHAEADRMPAFLTDADWGPWLGEPENVPDAAKRSLRTVEGVAWSMAPEPKAPKPKGR